MGECKLYTREEFSKMKKIVLLSIESVKRDLDSRLLLADLLVDNGYIVYIGYARKIFSLLCSLRNSIYIGRFITLGGSDVDKRILDICYENNNQFHYIHDEGGFLYEGDYKSYSKIVYPLEFLCHRAITSILFWGQKQLDVLREEMQSSLLKKSYVTGMYRFEMYKTKVACSNKSNMSDIVLMGRFSEPNPVSDDIKPFSEAALQLYKRSMCVDENNSFVNDMTKSWMKSTQEFTHFINMIISVATKYPHKRIVVRPHPAESNDIYNFFTSLFTNVTLDSNLDVRNTIMDSKVIVHTECTTGIESCMAQKPTINFRPLKDVYPDYEVAGAKDAGIVCTNIKEVLKHIDLYIDEDRKFEFESENIETLLFNFNKNITAYDTLFSVLNKFSSDVHSSFSIRNFLTRVIVIRLRFFIGDLFRLSPFRALSLNKKNVSLKKVSNIEIRNKLTKSYNLIKVSK